MAQYDYVPQGVCSYGIHFSIEEGKIHALHFDGGCEGNLKAIGMLVEGMEAKEVANMFLGNDCEGRGTSCADQLSIAITEALKEETSNV